MTTTQDRLELLLQRAIDDDGVEGEQAWDMFVSRVGKQKGELFFFEKNDRYYTNPLSFILDIRDERIAELEADVSHYKGRIDKLTKERDRAKAKANVKELQAKAAKWDALQTLLTT